MDPRRNFRVMGKKSNQAVKYKSLSKRIDGGEEHILNKAAIRTVSRCRIALSEQREEKEVRGKEERKVYSGLDSMRKRE